MIIGSCHTHHHFSITVLPVPALYGKARDRSAMHEVHPGNTTGYNYPAMEGPLIKDIPSIKKGLEDLRNLRALKNLGPLWRPILRLLGADMKQIDEAMVKIEELDALIRELAELPDRFNDLFANRGWIIYDLMDVEVAKGVIKKAEAGDIDGAEFDLVNYYDPGKVEWNLREMKAVAAFRPRMRLAQLALSDYREGRYHACIPVVLALLDGMVNELNEQNRGFFAEDVNLEAWDSVAAHSRGLNVLTRIFQTGRRKTVSDEITIPYRNGILHGMDLGYDNKIVAAKTWAALFAAREWALKAEQGLLSTPPPQPEPTWGERFNQLLECFDERSRIYSWEPRDLLLGVNVPVSGDPEAYENGTPEQKLAEYLSYWKVQNYGHMTRCVPPNLGYSDRRLPAILRNHYASKKLSTFEFRNIEDQAAAVTEIEARLFFENDTPVEETVVFRLINEDSKGTPSLRGKPGTYWVIHNWLI